jgi:ribosomal protein S18 acetylase RimI-like enzyme
MIRVIEELSINAWPSLQTMLYDGWVLRFADGYTRRANSINPIYPSFDDVGDKIQTCESLYRERGLNVVFKVTSAVYPAGLDDVLAGHGYAVDAQTSVQTLDLGSVQIADLGSMDRSPAQEVTLAESLSDAWLWAFCEMSGIPERRGPLLRRMLRSIAPAICFASIRHGDQTIACGLGVLQAGFVGLFDIVTDPQSRQQGYGTQLVMSILAWAQRRGARTAYLQVMLNNAPALRLYSKLGFAEIYQYWYRVKPIAD